MKKIIFGFTLLIVTQLLISLPLAFCQVDYKQEADNDLRQGRPSLAIEAYQKALRIHPASTATYFNLAIAYYSVRNIKGAVEALEKLTLLDPEDVEAQYNLACLRLYLRDEKQARQHFQKAKDCCRPSSAFTSLIDKGLQFVDKLDRTEPSDREILFFLLQYGLAPLSLAG